MTGSVKRAVTKERPQRIAGVVLGLLVLYAVLGFLLSPWIAERIATDKVREVFGAELRLGDVAINPFTFTVTIEDLEFDHPSGEPVARVGRIFVNLEPTAMFSRTLLLDEARVERAEILLQRDSQGDLNVASIRPLQPMPETPETDRPDVSWPFVVESLDVASMSVRLADETVAPAAELGITDVDLAVDGLSTVPDALFPFDVSMSLSTGGSIAANGRATLAPQPIVELAVGLRDVSPGLIHPYIRHRADLTFDSGTLDFDGDVATGPDDVLALTGDAEINDLLVTETDTGTRLGSWDRLAVNQIEFSLAKRSLGISEIVADALYADVLIAEDGSINLKRIGKDEEAGEDAIKPADPAADAGPSFDVTIGRVLVNDAAATFEDRALPLPFSANIDALSGRLSTIATSSAEPADVSLEGRVDEYGQIIVSGKVAPLDPRRNSSLDVEFVNVAMPKFSGYSVRFAGREIASGKMDLQLAYTVTDSKLAGENNIVLREFELGDAVPHPDAMDLPLGLAVALLKDPSGKIVVDLPVSGDLDNPDFSIGSVVGKAFSNLITGIVASPFKFLGKLLGVEADELGSLRFPPGRADLSPPQQEIAAKLAEALTLRPQLVLQIPGAYHVEADGLALREQAVDARIEAQIGDGGDAPYAERRITVIESLFIAEFGETLPAGEAAGDPVARAAAMRDRLVAAEPLDDNALEALGNARAENSRAAILASGADLESRVIHEATEALRATDEGDIELEVRLSTS